MISVAQGFRVTMSDAIDNRLVLTKAQMLSTRDIMMPPIYFAVCKDDNCLYIYNKAQTVLHPETGKFTRYDAAPITSITINGVEIQVNDKVLDIPLASMDQFGVVKAGTGIGVEEGVFSIDFNTVPDKSIPLSKINFDGLVIDGNIPIN